MDYVREVIGPPGLALAAGGAVIAVLPFPAPLSFLLGLALAGACIWWFGQLSERYVAHRHPGIRFPASDVSWAANEIDSITTGMAGGLQAPRGAVALELATKPPAPAVRATIVLQFDQRGRPSGPLVELPSVRGQTPTPAGLRELGAPLPDGWLVERESETLLLSAPSDVASHEVVAYPLTALTALASVPDSAMWTFRPI